MMHQCLRWKPVGWDALLPSILSVEFLKSHLTWICGWMRKYGRSCVELAALCSGPWWIWSCSSSSGLDNLLWEISAIASSGYLFYLSKKKKFLK